MWSTAKIAGLFILFGISVISVILPCITIRCLAHQYGASSKFKRALSILNCFSGGIFFATSVLDLLPEARESMEKMLKSRDIDLEFPLTECIMGTGFLFILFLEHVAHKCCSNKYSKDSNERRQRAISTGKAVESSAAVYFRKRPDSQLSNSVPTDDVIVVHDFEDSSGYDDVSYQTYGSVESRATGNQNWPYEVDPALPTNKTNRHLSSPNSNTSSSTFKEDTRILPAKHDSLDTSVVLQYAEDKSRGESEFKTLRSMILLMALSIHMIFDGLALGLQEKQSKIWNLVLALGIHKILVFFTIGLQLMELLKSVRKAIVVGVIIACVSPLGILIGELINSSGSDVTTDTVSAVLQSFATGTFIFVTFFEILQQELNSPSGEHDILKVLGTIVGFAVIAVTKLFIHEEE